MEVKLINTFMDDLGDVFSVGDTVTVYYTGGSGLGGCVITNITKTGFHYTQGRRIKSLQFNDISDVVLRGKALSERRCTGKSDVAGELLYEGDYIKSLVGGEILEIRYGIHDAYCPVDTSLMDGVGFYAVSEGFPDMPIGNTEEYAEKIGNIYDDPGFLDEREVV